MKKGECFVTRQPKRSKTKCTGWVSLRHAPRKGLTLQEKPAKAGGDIDEALRNVSSKETSDGIFIICSGLFSEPFKKIVTVASQKKLPVWNCFPEQTGGEGALISYHPHTYRNGHRELGMWTKYSREPSLLTCRLSSRQSSSW